MIEPIVLAPLAELQIIATMQYFKDKMIWVGDNRNTYFEKHLITVNQTMPLMSKIAMEKKFTWNREYSRIKMAADTWVTPLIES